MKIRNYVFSKAKRLGFLSLTQPINSMKFQSLALIYTEVFKLSRDSETRSTIAAFTTDS